MKRTLRRVRAAPAFVIGGFLALGLLIGLTNAAVRRTFTGLRARDNLARFLPRQIVDRVLRSGGVDLLPVQGEVTVLFSDIRDFTGASPTATTGTRSWRCGPPWTCARRWRS